LYIYILAVRECTTPMRSLVQLREFYIVSANSKFAKLLLN